MSRLHIYRASAGSGKTFRLTMEYLKLALKEESAYQNILAVTFTNKATTEMKYRVMQELNLLGNGENTPYRSLLVNETNLSDSDITVKAKRCLKNILHNYTRFSITTIDKFFQRVISSFNRELGIHVSYQIEIDENRMLQDSVDSLLSSVEPGSELINWLKTFAKEKIQEGGGWKLKKDIFSLGKNIGNEKFKEYYEESFQKLNDKKFLKNYHDLLYKYTLDYQNHLAEIGKQGLLVMKGMGLSEDDFSYKASGPAGAFLKMQNKIFDMLGKSRVLKASVDSSAFHKKKDRPEIIEASVRLQPLLTEAVNYYDDNAPSYETAGLINKQLYTLGILVDLKKEMEILSSDREVILISESNTLIHKIIDDSDTPFIYEKMGSYYHHFMIDEFQDTSDLQWNNFKPLLENSLSEGNFSMVVGDVKQSIYRFRNGDWNLLQNKVALDFPEPVEKNLDTNWRSLENVVRFNNTIFSFVPLLIQNILEEDGYNENNSFLTSLYADSLQEIGKKDNKEKGHVRMYFTGYAGEENKQQQNKDPHNEESGEEEFSVLEALASQIELLQNNGVPSGKITILINKKSEAAEVATFLMNKGNRFKVISDNSLVLEDDPIVSFIISVFSLLLDPENQIAIACLNYQYNSTILPELEENNLKPAFLHENASESSDAEIIDADPLNARASVTEDSEAQKEEEISDLFENKDNENDELNNFLKSNYFRVTLLSMNLQELVVRIGEIFHFFDLNSHQAYLLTFLDLLSGYDQKQNTDISSFLTWWSELSNKKSITVSDNLDAISIQTIHKSKGLENDYIFIPFCDWSLDYDSPNKYPILWCKPDKEPFNRIEMIPVRYGSNMKKSLFLNEYMAEKRDHYIDKLNMMYVAFTRAKKGLYTWTTKKKTGKTVGDLLHESIYNSERNILKETTKPIVSFRDYIMSENLFEIGSLCKNSQEEETLDGDFSRIKKVSFSDFHQQLRLRKNYDEFFEKDGSVESKINRGNLIHHILSQVSISSDLNRAIYEAFQQGMIPSGEINEIKKQLLEMVTDEEVKLWFDGSYEVINERNILTGENLKRPDRIMLTKTGDAIVVDYKSGEMEPSKYRRQILRYMADLKQCGYKKVSGYLWYTRENKRVRITDNFIPSKN